MTRISIPIYNSQVPLILFSKAPSISDLFLLLPLFLFVSCSPEFADSISERTNTPQKNNASLLLVPSQVEAPQSIKSIQLYAGNNPRSLPVIELGSNSPLTLEFDELSYTSGQFIIRVTHQDSGWNKSTLAEPWYIDGNNEFYITGGTLNKFLEPQYFHYKKSFTELNRAIKVSGNYLLHVYDFSSNTELFSLPFFVTEQSGELTLNTTTLFNQGENGEAIDQVTGTFSLPDYIEFPRYSLNPVMAQNRFWGTSRNIEGFDLTDENELSLFSERDQSFYSNFEVSRLDLTDISLQNNQIYNVERDETPRKIILRDDVLNFTSDNVSIRRSVFGLPDSDRRAAYNNVTFRLNTGRIYNREIFLIGDFTNWTLKDQYKLSYNTELDVYETNALIKDGLYTYTYAYKEYGMPDILTLSDSVTKRQQEYTVIIYYTDPDMQYQRILHVGVLNSLY